MSHNLKKRCRRGVTLVELLVALAVVAVLSTAVTVLLTGAGKIHQYVNNETDAMSQVENAYRRMMHNIRTSSVTPTAASNVLTVQSQPDSSYGPSPLLSPTNNSNTPAQAIATYGSVIKYQIATSGANSGALVESDDRFPASGGGANVLIPASASPSFTVTATTGSVPTQVTITIKAYPGSQYQVVRSVVITCRNF